MPPLYGRDVDLSILTGLLADIASGTGAAAIAVAEGGGGKTALFEAFTAQARETADVAWGTCADGEGAPPFWPWVQILRRVDQSGEDSLARRALTALGGRHNGEADRFAAFDAVARAITERDSPLVLVLDDLHWSDGGSLQLLQFLAPLIRPAPVLLLVGTRPTDRADVGSALATLVRRGAARLPLRPLAPSEVTTFLQAAGADSRYGQRVSALTGGNPFFVGEMARQLAHGGDSLNVPRPVMDVLRAEFGRLSEEARRLATTCALLDGPIFPSLALRVAKAGRSALNELETGAFLLPDGDSYRFRHDIMRDAIRSFLTANERRHAEALIAEAARETGDLLLTAIHGCRAGEAWDVATAHAAAVAARDEAMGRYALESAALLTDMARAIRRAVPLSDHQQLQLDLTEGELYTRLGRQAEGREALRGATRLGRTLGDSAAVVRAALTFRLGYEHGNADDPEVTALLEDALVAVANEDHASRALLLSRLAWQVLDGRRVGDRRRYSAEAVREAQMSEDPGTLATALNAHCWALALPEDLPERRAAARAASLAAHDAHDAEAELGALMWVFRSELEAGAVQAARAAAREFGVIVARAPLPYHAWYAGLFQGTLALIDGDFDRAASIAAQLDPAATSQETQARVNIETLRSEVDLARASGTGELAVASLERLHQVAEETMGVGWMVAPHLAALRDGREAAIRQLDQVLRRAIPSEAGEDWLVVMSSLAAAAVITGSAPHARELIRRLEPYAGHWIIIGNGGSCRGPVSSFLAGLACVAGIEDEADRYRVLALEALETHNAAGLKFWLDLRPRDVEWSSNAGSSLTPREREVLVLLTRGLSNQQIADALVLSARTVQRHVENVYRRLDVHNRAGAAAEAVRLGLIDAEEALRPGHG